MTRRITDRQRLDFMSTNPRSVVYRRGVQRPPVEYLARAEERWKWTLHHNLRAAIDAAIKAERRRRAKK